ncbi:tandem-95 repeat protein [Paenibacillus cymbidii]|uniref:tandem-95 repeat protein n=1 Tax=Paenibacillus cymbidii TaxID=1639034 RepID=UPI0014369883|nr:tandem-95 repeat protein [Paenibacillus cymbidii]
MFTTPVSVPNPISPTITVAIDDGGDGILSAPQNLTQVTISGTTTAQVGQTVNLTLTSSTNVVTVLQAPVLSGGTYSVSANLSGFADGTISVNADVVDTAGNPATTANDTTVKDTTAPTANAQSVVTDKNTAKSITLSGSDALTAAGDLLYQLSSLTTAQGGTLVQSGTGSGVTYTPATGYTGSDSFTFTVKDKAGLESAQATVSITVNAPPVVSNIDKNGTEDTDVMFKADDFTVKFTDVDSDSLNKVKITSLPAHGTLKLGGVTVTVYQEIDASALGNLKFTPDPNWNGETTFHWNGKDGALYAELDAKVTIEIAAENDKPVVANIDKDGTEDTDVMFTADDFTVKFTDVDNDSLSKVKITSLPAHGTLKLGGVTVTVYQEIDASALGNLKFTPDPNWNGETTFHWNGKDGALYAELDAKVTIEIAAENDKPVVANIDKDGTEDTDVMFTADDFTVKFTDVDNDSLSKVKITSLPAHGTLKLGGVTVTVYQEIDASALGNLKFTPDPNWNGETTFHWNGKDGSLYAELDAKVTIEIAAVNDKPIVADIAKSGDGTPIAFSATDFENKFTDLDGDELSRVKVMSLPEHGTLKLNGVAVTVYQEINTVALSGMTFEPNADWNGTTSFAWNGNDGVDYAAVDANVILTVEQLEGWAGSRGYEVVSPIWVAAPGKPLKLSAFAPAAVGKVSATFDFEGGSTAVELSPVGAVNNGTQRWEATTYSLPYTVTTGVYQAQFATYIETSPGTWTPALAEPAAKLTNNKFKVIARIAVTGNVYDYTNGPSAPIANVKVSLYDPTGTVKVAETTTDANGNYNFPSVATEQYLIVVEKTGYGTQKRIVNTLPTDPDATVIRQDFALVEYNLQLTANPSSIVGDGNSKSLLKAVLRNGSGVELANVPVTFTASVGTFEKLAGDISSPLPNTVITNAFGEAYIYYKSAAIEGVISQQIPVTATADDPARSLYAQEQIIVTFEPTSIKGVIKQNGVTQAGVTVKIVEDFNHDGIIDFAAEAVTDENGNYTIAVPKGNQDYKLQVTKPVVIDGVEKSVTFVQNAPVGNVTGTGVNYDSNQAVTGVIALKPPAGQSQVIDNNNQMKNAVKVYLKDKATGTYVGGNATPTAFTLDNGVFNAEIPAGDYELEVRFVVPNAADPTNHALDKEIIINALDAAGTLPVVTVTATGELNIVSELIDPYGDITDATTNAPIDGATVTLYYASTSDPAYPGNVGKEGQQVWLPAIVGFDPNDNANPQTSKNGGKYAYMVYPTTQYVIRVTKDGYEPYTSPTISVDYAIVRHDIKMTPVPPATGGGAPAPVVTPTPTPTTTTPTPEPKVDADVAVNITTARSSYEEGSLVPLKIDYVNISDKPLSAGMLTVTLPQGVTIVDPDGGTVDGNKIAWGIVDLAAGGEGSRFIKVKFPASKAAEQTVDVETSMAVSGVMANKANARSSLKLLLFSNRYGTVEHTRYILGYPDGEFKPQRSLSRAELAAIVARLINGGNTDKKAAYSDVPASHWASGYIRIATDAGIFTGFTDGTFHPDVPVTREELATVMTRYLKLDTPQSIDQHFADASDRWSTTAIEALYRNGLVQGYPDGTFQPAGSIIRLEAVTLINRMLFRGPLTSVEPSFPDVPKDNWGFGHVEEASQSHDATRREDGSEVFVQHVNDNVQ